VAGTGTFSFCHFGSGQFYCLLSMLEHTNFKPPDRFLGLFLVLMETNILMETMGSIFHNFFTGNRLQQQPFRTLFPKCRGEGVSGGSGNEWP
jgi:hypothetical protein